MDSPQPSLPFADTAGFHPAVWRWFAGRFGAPTEVQRQAWAVTLQHRPALVTAPTGSGKTLAAFLGAINDLVIEGLNRGLEEEVHVLYVSPLKALSNDIQKNLQEPLAGIRAQLKAQGYPDVDIRDGVRTGDTSQFERDRMRKHPPHILVTTPESLFILLTSPHGRGMFKRVRTVIVDELHAVAGSKRGAHLMLSLERLSALCEQRPVRVGLSATVKPVEAMAELLVGDGDCAIVDTGHVRERDLAIELPGSPLETVMSTEVWGEIYDRLAELTRQHRTTLIFVNQRRVSERVARHLAERIGEEHVTAHHGSLAKEHRLKAEQMLKAGKLKALVATSSLELGIDIGDIDLVCQLGSPRAIAAFLQRVGRAGHAVGATPKGRLFPLSIDDLGECAALFDAVRRGELERIQAPDKPRDVLAQHILGEVACQDWGVDDLWQCFRRARPYRELGRDEFLQVVQMLADGYATKRGRRLGGLHYDAVNQRLRGRRGTRILAVTNAGVIPDQFDYEVVLSPEGHRVGTLNEDFAFESLAGDIVQLGNTSYRILKVETGKVYVEDARGQPPNMPFWLGEAPSRSAELSSAVSRLMHTADAALGETPAAGAPTLQAWLADVVGLNAPASQQLTAHLAAAKAALGVLPTQDTLIFERFFDEVDDTHLVIHSPYGSRINRAWGLALRKRFCRSFNFELQASALEDSIVLSLGPRHSFPLEDVKGFLKSTTAREILVQALLDAPMFGTRWRWNASVALAVRRMNGGKRVPPQFQRSDAEDLLAMVFPDQLACAENLTGDREVPDHPLVNQTIDDCLHQTMDVDGFLALLRKIESGEVQVLCRDLTAPSPLAGPILNARPYTFLDDGAAEERRTRAVAQRRATETAVLSDLAQLDAAALARVREECLPNPANADELHDELLIHGFLTAAEAAPWAALVAELQAQQRVIQRTPDGGEQIWIAAERVTGFGADETLPRLLQGRLELLGPVTAAALGKPLGRGAVAVEPALYQLEAEGSVMRGNYTGRGAVEWCDRRLLARTHRYTRERSHAEVQPVPPAAFMRFLLRWHGLTSTALQREGEAGLLAVLQQLEGFAVPAAAWEQEILPARVKQYSADMLDRLCGSGRMLWWRPAQSVIEDAPRKSGPVKATPVVLAERASARHWQSAAPAQYPLEALSFRAQKLLEALREHGASFFADLQQATGLLRTDIELGLGELVSLGLATCDSFAGLRALITPAARRHRRATVEDAGRWSLQRPPAGVAPAGSLADPGVEHVARALLRRYGVVFRKLLEREDHLPPWRDLLYVYRRLEARGEARGGRFVNGFSGEQYALADAAALLKKVTRDDVEELVAISAADPLNLAGIVTPGEKVPALAGNRLLFRNGVPAAQQIGDELRYLQDVPSKTEWEIRNLLVRRARPGAWLPEPKPLQ